jgi:hypothetical protein
LWVVICFQVFLVARRHPVEERISRLEAI